MANRSYLYSLDFDINKEKRNEGKKVCGLSEWPYDIPLAYKILMSQESKLSKSIIWETDEKIAILGNFYKGRERLFSFLDKLLKMNLLDKNELESQIFETKEYLNDSKHENKYIILECGEIFEMNEDELENQNKFLYEDILKIDVAINNFIEEIKKPLNKDHYDVKKLINRNKLSIEKAVNTVKLNLLGIAFWSDVLYYG